MTRRGVRLALAAGLGLILAALAGCAATDPGQPGARVAETVAGRTGQEITWQSDDQSREKAAEQVKAMLAHGLTLPEALAIGLANNRRIQGLYQELGAAQAGYAQAGLLRNPHLTLSYLDSTESGFQFNIEIVQNILSLFMLPLRESLAEAELNRAESLVAGEVVKHLHLVRAAYLRLQADQRAFELRRQLLDASQAAYDLGGRMRQAGNVTRLSLLNQRAARDQDRLALSAASQAVAASRERLNRLLGLWGSDLDWTVPPAMADVPEQELVTDGLEARCVQASLELAQARHGLEAAARRAGITDVTSVLPGLGVGAAFERETDGSWLRGPVLELELPIFDPGHAKRGAIKAELTRRWEDYTALAVEVRSRARAAARALSAARERALYLRDSYLPLRQEITRQAQLRYNGMFLGVFELLGYKRMEIMAALEYARALADYWTARSALMTLLAGSMAETPAVSVGAAPAAAMEGGGH